MHNHASMMRTTCDTVHVTEKKWLQWVREMNGSTFFLPVTRGRGKGKVGKKNHKDEVIDSQRSLSLT